MPRFVGNPVLVEAHQYQGNTLNMDGQFGAAFLRYETGAGAQVKSHDGVRHIAVGDWLVRLPTGAIEPMRNAAFEAMFSVPQQDDKPAIRSSTLRLNQRA